MKSSNEYPGHVGPVVS